MALDWERLRIFHVVAQARSFTKAGEILNLSQSAVSRQISALEKSLGVSLFNRHARGLILSEPGEMMYRTIQEISAKLVSVENSITEGRERPKGPLKVTTTIAFGSNWLMPIMHEFMEDYPEITITLLLDDRELDLAMREADVGIRLYHPRQPDLIQRHLMSIRTGVYASDIYIRKHGIPQKIEDLDLHRVIVFGEETRPPYANIDWLLKLGRAGIAPRKAAFKVNNLGGIFQAVQSGMGIASLPEYMIPPESNLIRILDGLEGPQTDAFLVYPAELRYSKRINVFRDFVVRKVAERVV